MSGLAHRLRALLEAGRPAVLVRVVEVRGSAPREPGAAMLVTTEEIVGTVGGGMLEWRAIARARTMLAAAEDEAALDLPLGPALGQCCGGRVRLLLRRADPALLATLDAEEEREHARRPEVLLFGAGHVGRALARSLAPLPLRLVWVDPRPEAFPPSPPQGIRLRPGPAPVRAFAEHPAARACLVATHDHGLDFELVAEALGRGTIVYCGLIGSASKKARFLAGLRALGRCEDELARLVCPIGGPSRDKRPEVIAALATAELWRALEAAAPGIGEHER
ncbi:MAG: xanthine dehydrogenase accessory protein XdhC [Geminicoccaceae bacterium]|nr:xanthine dehydrogenase accessory protein XdhC [Geminicoccaceae bacterium]